MARTERFPLENAILTVKGGTCVAAKIRDDLQNPIPLKFMQTSWADHHPCPARNVVFARERREGSRKKTEALGLGASACRGRKYNLSGWLKAAVGIALFVFSTSSALPNTSTLCPL